MGSLTQVESISTNAKIYMIYCKYTYENRVSQMLRLHRGRLSTCNEREQVKGNTFVGVGLAYRKSVHIYL